MTSKLIHALIEAHINEWLNRRGDVEVDSLEAPEK